MDHLLEIMLNDMKAAPDLYQPTPFWRHGVQRVLDDLRCHGVERFRALSSALNFFTPTYAFPGFYQRSEIYLQLERTLAENNAINPRRQLSIKHFLSGELQAFNDYRVYRATLQDGPPFIDRISESNAGEPVEQFTFEGRRFSRSLLNYFLGLNFLKTHCDLSHVHTVLEIGGGYGTLGEILLGDARNHCFYVNIDIPPTGFVSTYYLKQVLGEPDVGDYGVLKEKSVLDISALSEEYQAVVLCPWQLPDIRGTIDLFVNFISFQEMEPAVVKNYLYHVDRLRAEYILLRNLREGKSKAKKPGELGVLEPIKGNDYDLFLPNYQLVAVNTVPFGCKTVDNFHSELRIYQRKNSI